MISDLFYLLGHDRFFGHKAAATPVHLFADILTECPVQDLLYSARRC